MYMLQSDNNLSKELEVPSGMKSFNAIYFLRIFCNEYIPAVCLKNERASNTCKNYYENTHISELACPSQVFAFCIILNTVSDEFRHVIPFMIGAMKEA